MIGVLETGCILGESLSLMLLKQCLLEKLLKILNATLVVLEEAVVKARLHESHHRLLHLWLNQKLICHGLHLIEVVGINLAHLLVYVRNLRLYLGNYLLGVLRSNFLLVFIGILLDYCIVLLVL